jgi:uncharacterized YigZ family protein
MSDFGFDCALANVLEWHFAGRDFTQFRCDCLSAVKIRADTMRVRYPIPAGPFETESTVDRSWFIASISPAESVSDAKAFIQSIRGRFADATHHVYAYRIGYGGSINEGLSDDGEPSGTAGRPCMAVLRGSDLGDVVLVVTRYFGGIRLGKGGLVRAYTEAAQLAVQGVSRTEKVKMKLGTLSVPYAAFESIRKLLSKGSPTILEEAFDSAVTFRITCAVDEVEALEASLREISAGRYYPVWDEEV